jgi:rhodanese-related sulfurtransferase
MLKAGIAIVVVGVAFGLAANGLSPRGLTLGRDYFPPTPTPANPRPDAVSGAVFPNTTSPALRSKRGLPVASHTEVATLFTDPRFAQQRIIFIDARDDDHFASGHIPGAYQFDHYRLDRHLAEILGVVPLAERIVVYCNGGDCEDSELATLDLLSLGVPAAKLVIYAGGITEWKQHHLPVEMGPRGSGRTESP